MHKLLMLLDKLAQKDSISAAEKAELEQVYNELPKEDHNDDLNKAVAETLAKFDEGEGSSPAPAADGGAAPAAPAEGGEGEGGAGDGSEGEKPKDVDGEVKANEDGTFTVDSTFMESVKGMQKNLSAMSQKATLQACESKARALCFSDKQPTNVVLPKHVTKIAQFASGLSEDKRKVFFEIIGSLKAVPAGSVGHGKTTGTGAHMNFNDPKSIPADDEKVTYFMETMKQSLEDAQKSAAHYYAEKAKQGK